MAITWLNSVEKIAERDLNELRENNATIRRLRYGHVHAWLITASSQPFRNPAELFVLFLLLSLLTYQLSTFSWFPSLIIPNIDDFHVRLLIIQTTLAALTYPIVIGLVSILLQGRQSAKARVQIYLIDSGALIAGLSSLFLILTMVVQSGFIPLVTLTTVTIWTYLDLLWFIGNAAGTTWFLFRSVEFIRPNQQAIIIKHYGVNIGWLMQLKQLIKCHCFWSAKRYGHLPGAPDGEEKEDAKPQVLLSPVWKDRGQVEASTSLPGSRTLRDIKLRPLGWVVRRWIQRSMQIPLQPKVLGLRAESPKLILPLWPGETYEGDAILCRRDGGSRLQWWERIVLRWCFIFTKLQYYGDIGN